MHVEERERVIIRPAAFRRLSGCASDGSLLTNSHQAGEADVRKLLAAPSLLYSPADAHVSEL